MLRDQPRHLALHQHTAQAEAAIDLQAMERELLAIEERIRTATQTHADLLRQLGLPWLPGD